MDDKRLDEIQERCDAATLGPWLIDSECDGIISGDLDDNAAPLICMNGADYDNEFVIHARTDLPDCVAEIRRLRGIATKAIKSAADHGCDRSDLIDEIYGELMPESPAQRTRKGKNGPR